MYMTVAVSSFSNIALHHNVAESDGGALSSYDHCRITIG